MNETRKGESGSERCAGLGDAEISVNERDLTTKKATDTPVINAARERRRKCKEKHRCEMDLG